MKPTNCVRMYGLPIQSRPKISPPDCWYTISCMLRVPAWMTTPTTARIIGSS